MMHLYHSETATDAPATNAGGCSAERGVLAGTYARDPGHQPRESGCKKNQFCRIFVLSFAAVYIMRSQFDWSSPELPLARIKKIMKSEDDIKSELGGQKFMISSEAPVIFAKVLCSFYVCVQYV